MLRQHHHARRRSKRNALRLRIRNDVQLDPASTSRTGPCQDARDSFDFACVFFVLEIFFLIEFDSDSDSN